MKILSIDDNRQNLKLIERSLESHFTVFSHDGQGSLIEVLSSFTPDVILLDIMLGDRSGYDLCREIRQSNICPEAIVIFVSSLSSLEDKIAAYGAGGDDYICKPINLQELDHKLNSLQKRLISQHSLAEQYESAAMAAYSSMQQSSELGLLINFFTDTTCVTQTDELYRAIAAFVSRFGSQCAVEFRIGKTVEQLPLGSVTTLESEILELGRSAKRIITFGNNLLLNSSRCSLLVKRVSTEDAELQGRLRDHYAILLGIIDSRLTLIENMLEKQQARMQAIKQVSNAVVSGFGHIKTELVVQERQIQEILQQLESAINISLLSIGLSEQQEEALMAIFEESREQFEGVMGTSVHIDNEIRKLDHLLGRIS